MNQILPKTRITNYNGIEVKWFIGDINRDRALTVGAVKEVSGYKTISGKGAYWEAWGSANGHAYQLCAWYDEITRELVDIRVLGPKQIIINSDGTRTEEHAYYFHKKTYDLLTAKK